LEGEVEVEMSNGVSVNNEPLIAGNQSTYTQSTGLEEGVKKSV